MAYPWSAHDILTASDLNAAIASSVMTTGLGAWTAYTPVWTGTSTNPVIGNGTITGKYCKTGRLVVGSFTITVGSTTTFGSGGYVVSLPFSSATGGLDALGTATCYDSSAATRFMRHLNAFAANSAILVSEAGALTTSAVPMTWATGDIIAGKFVFESTT